jgi:hypothetical protein
MPGVCLDHAFEDTFTITAAIGIQDTGVVVREVSYRGKALTIICVPLGTWSSPGEMAMLLHLKTVMATLHRRVLLIPESWVRRQPRLDNALMVSGSAGSSMTVSTRMRVLTRLIEEDSASLSELAALVPGDDPVSGILHLVTLGLLEIDLDRSIMPTSLVSLARTGARQ